jgi:hypothetical protein
VSTISSVAVVTFMGDGKPDWLGKFDNNVLPLLGKGNGSFQSPINYGTGTNPNFVAVGDLNGDANPEGPGWWPRYGVVVR